MTLRSYVCIVIRRTVIAHHRDELLLVSAVSPSNVPEPPHLLFHRLHMVVDAGRIYIRNSNYEIMQAHIIM